MTTAAERRIANGEERIKHMELELAKLQAEETTPHQITANLVRDALRQTLRTAAALAEAAHAVIEEAVTDLDESVVILAHDLNGGESNDSSRSTG